MIGLQVFGSQVDIQVQNLSIMIPKHDISIRAQIRCIGCRRVASWMYE